MMGPPAGAAVVPAVGPTKEERESMKVNVPVPFEGSKADKAANYRTHQWWMHDPEEPLECGKCAAKSSHVAATWPCGVEPPRMVITNEREETTHGS